MRLIKDYHTGKHIWAKPAKFPRTVRGQLAFANDLHTKIMLDFTDEDHDLYNPDYGWGRNAAGVTSNQVNQWLVDCVKKQARDRKKNKQPGWRNLWLANSPVLYRRRCTCLECAKEMYAEEFAA